MSRRLESSCPGPNEEGVYELPTKGRGEGMLLGPNLQGGPLSWSLPKDPPRRKRALRVEMPYERGPGCMVANFSDLVHYLLFEGKGHAQLFVSVQAPSVLNIEACCVNGCGPTPGKAESKYSVGYYLIQGHY